MKKMALVCILGLIYILCPPGAEAAKEDLKDKISFQNCIRVSLANSPEAKIAKEIETDAREAINERQAAYWPGISFMAKALFEEKEGDSYPSSIGVRWDIFDKGRRRFALKAAEEDYLSSQWQERLIYQDVIHRTASAYIRRALCEEVCLLAEEVLSEEKRRLGIVKTRSKKGLVSELDVVSIEAEVREAQIVLSKASSERRISISSLNHAMGIDIDEPIRIEKIEHIWWNKMIDEYKNIKVCFEKAFLGRMDYKIIECKLRVKEVNLKSVRAKAWPNIFLEAGYYLSGQSSEESGDFNAGLALDIPLFEGGLRKAQIKRAETQVRIVPLEKEMMENQIYEQVIAAHEKLQNLQEELRLQDEKLSFLSKSLEAEKSLYDAGMSDIGKLNDARQEYVSHKLKLTQIKYDILADFLLLLRAIGETEIILERIPF